MMKKRLMMTKKKKKKKKKKVEERVKLEQISVLQLCTVAVVAQYSL